MPSNVGVVGYGFTAKIFHIPFIQQVPDLKLYAVVQRTPTPDNDAEKDFPGIKSFRSAEDMVRDPAVDVVVVTTAPDSHYSLTKLALENGKHGQLASVYTPISRLTMNSHMRKTFYSNLQRGSRAQCHCESQQQAPGRLPKYTSSERASNP